MRRETEAERPGPIPGCGVGGGFGGPGLTIFEKVSRLAAEHGAINLGQGFPDGDGPRDVLEKAAEALLDGDNQYPPLMGVPALRKAVADHDLRFYGIEADWDREVLVTIGATEALAASLLGLLNPGDEVVLFQPLYDAYAPMVRRAGGVPRFVTLTPPEWRLTRAALERAFSSRTKVVLFNNPLNPAGRVFSREELTLLAEFTVDAEAIAIADEVYEHIIFDGRPHIPLITLPGMRDRCLKIGSAGKTFSLTGWKVGYVTGAAPLIAAVAKAHQFLVFTTPPNLQHAVAYGLGKDDAYFRGLAHRMAESRNRLTAGLTECGLAVLPCEGGYFVNVDLAASGITESDEAFCRRIVVDPGVAAIPVSAFYVENAPANIVRFCFAKSDALLDAALERLAQLAR